MPGRFDSTRRQAIVGGLATAGALSPLQHASAADAPQVVELRQYTCFGGRRDDLIRLFEREFIESQAAVGAQVLGTFRDRDDPDRFVWMRGFADMASRARALDAFYSGPVWRAHRNAANATIRDSDNVLLLRPLGARAGIGKGAGETLAFIHYLAAPQVETFTGFFENRLRREAEAVGLTVVGTFVTEAAANSFPRLPVREGERVFVWFAEGRSGALEAFRARSGWRDDAPETLLPALMRKPELLRLEPTPRSPSRRSG